MNIKELKEKYNLKVYKERRYLYHENFSGNSAWYTGDPFRRLFYAEYRKESCRPFPILICKHPTEGLTAWIDPYNTGSAEGTYNLLKNKEEDFERILQDVAPDYAILCNKICGVYKYHCTVDRICLEAVSGCNRDIFNRTDPPTFFVKRPIRIHKDESNWKAVVLLDGTVIYACKWESLHHPVRYISPKEVAQQAVLRVTKVSRDITWELLIPNWDVDFEFLYRVLEKNFTDIRKNVLKWD